MEKPKSKVYWIYINLIETFRRSFWERFVWNFDIGRDNSSSFHPLSEDWGDQNIQRINREREEVVDQRCSGSIEEGNEILFSFSKVG